MDTLREAEKNRRRKWVNSRKDRSEDTTGERDQEREKSECDLRLRSASWPRHRSVRGRDLHGIQEIRTAKPARARPN